MEMKNLKIGTQLKAGLGIILACVAILGIMAWLNSDLLWQETRGLYNHPFQVRKAIGELRADILAIHRDMKDLCLHEDDYEHQNILHVIDAREADAYRQFEVLFDKYLGSRKDIDDAFEAFVQWKAIRDETINMLKSGNIAQAAKRTKSSGAGGSHVEKLLAHVNKISYRSATKAEKFYERAFEQSNFLKIRLAFIVGIILLLSMVLSYLLLKKIKDPLWELTETTKHFQEGNLNARSKHVSGNEVGQLAFAFNNMAEKVQNEIEIRKRTNSVSGVMLHEDDLRPFCQKLLDVLIENTKSQIGAIYLLTEEKTVFEHFESIGLGSAYRKDFSAIEYEGEFGIALATKQISHINRIPDGTQFIFSTTAGDLIPKEIITIPILSNKDVIAIISIASIHEYSSQAIQLVHGIWQVLCARLNGVLAFRKIREFSEVPIIILTVRSEDTDVLKGLETGADDYIVKPFNYLTLLARIQAVLRRTSKTSLKEDNTTISPHMKIDFINQKISVDDRLVRLTPVEYRLLLLLVKNKGWVVPYKKITQEIWGNNDNKSSENIRISIQRLRHKLKDNPPTMIINERGRGYIFKG